MIIVVINILDSKINKNVDKTFESTFTRFIVVNQINR